MNGKTYRLVYSRLREMVVAVGETATTAGKSAGGETHSQRRGVSRGAVVTTMAAMFGAAPAIIHAQIAPTPGIPTHVIQTPSGLPQVNIAKPSGAGVSVNTYNQFDVQKSGAILNNSPTMVQTQQAGMINGNPNFGSGQSARIIVNQVNSTSASQIRGYVEVAGNRAEVVLANPTGIVVDGGGFINTSRATLTTGQPYYGADGSLAGYHVDRGLITVQGAGLNASNVDQVDLISRAVQVNAAIYAKDLNVVGGANQVDRNTLAATLTQGEGAAPSVAIDVSQLGGMYADRILLVSNEHGVGVANAGTIAAQSGDLTLQSNGRLVLVGKTNAAGNLTIAAQDGIENSGTTYGEQHVSVSTAGTLANSGALAALQNLNIAAGNIASTGSLGAGVKADGAVGGSGDLTVAATGQLTATGQNVAGGNLALTGSGVDLSGSKTAANADVLLRAQAGDLKLVNATTSAQRAIDVRASGTLRNDRGTLSSRTGTTIQVGSLSNRGGQISAVGPLAINTSAEVANQGGTLVTDGALTLNAGEIANNAGTMQSGGVLSVTGTSLDNTAGRIVSLNADGMSLSTTGQLTNAGGTTATGAQGGVIGGNGDLSVHAGAVVNRGSLTAQHALQVTTIRLDNGDGAITADRLHVTATDLQNTRGMLTQYGGQDTVLNVSGTFDNANGTIQTNGVNLTLAPSMLNNASGTMIHAGTGALILMPGLGSGLLANAGGSIVSRGTVALSAGAFDNIGGTLAALGSVSARIGGELNNTGGSLVAGGDVTLDAGSVINAQGGQLSGANVQLRADSLNNDGGRITGADGDIGIVMTGAVSNAGGQFGATRNLSVSASTLYGGGAYSAANDLTLNLQGDFTNAPTYRFNVGRNLAFTLPGTFSNVGELLAVGDLTIDAGTVVNRGAINAGNWLRTNSDTLTNTGAMVGGSVSLAAAFSLTNVGPTALIGASDGNGMLELLAQTIENRDDTTATDTPALTAIYGLGRVVLAGGKDAAGRYTKAARILNQSGLIQSDGDMALHADLVTNTRREMQTAWTSQVDAALLETLGISLSGRVGEVNVKDPANIGGVYIEPPHGGKDNSDYLYTTYTGTLLANLVSKISPAAQIVAGGNLDASSVDTLQNYWSRVTAAGDIAMPGMLDQDSWKGQLAPQIKVTYTGQYWYRTYKGRIWSYSFCDAPGCNGPSDVREYALPSYESSIVANGTLSGTGVSVDNPAGNAGIPSIGLPPGVDVGGGIDRVIASATAVDVLKNLTIPQGGLFHPHPASDANYLIESNPAFTSTRSFMSSDYYLRQLGLNPDQTEKRLGDGFYEQWLVRNQLTSLTGKTVLGPYTDIESMYQALLSSGAELSKSLNLPLGMGLSAEQVAQLQGNVVLMEKRVVDGQAVLVPVVYLAQASQPDMSGGPLIAAGNIDLRDVQSFSNGGTIRATDSLSIDGQSIDNRFGALQSGGRMTLATTGTIDLTSASVKAGGLALAAGGDLILDTATQARHQTNADGATRVSTTLGPQASIDVAGNAAIATGGNFQQNAGRLSVDGDLGMRVGGDWTLGAQQVGERKVVERANGVSDTDINRSVGSSVKVGGKSAIAVGGDVTAKGAQIELGGGGAIVAGGTVTLGAASATSTVNSSSSGNEGNRSYAETYHSSDQALTGTTLTGGDNVAIVAGKDLNVIGSAISLDKGNASLAAAGDVNIGAATETHELNAHETHSRSGVVSGTKVASGIDQTMTLNQGSLVSADGVTIAAGRDLIVQGSTVVGTNDVALGAVRNVTITASQDTLTSSSYYQKKETGLMSGGGLSVSVGSSSLKTTSQTSDVLNNASMIGSLNGSLKITAGNDLHVTGSDLIAAQNISGTGANVTIDAAQDFGHRAQTQEISKSGLTLALKAPVIDAVSNAVGQSRAASQGQDGRAAALHGMAAASAAWDANMAAGDLVRALGAGETPQFKVEASIGSSHSKSAFSEDRVTNRGSSVNAGGTVAFAATGNGQPGSGNVTIAGSDVNANDVILAAKNQVNIVNTTDTDATRSTNESKSASVGVSVGTGGFGVSAAMSKANGDGNSDLATQNNSHVNAANTVTIISGGDTNIVGSNVSGNQVNADVGGNLNIASVQDTLSSAAHQSSSGGGFSVSQGGASANFSQSKGNATGSYVGVAEQAGIQAGDGGFNLNVKGNTDLKGAVIASDADASKNSLTTGSLSFSEVQNQSSYDAKSSGFSAGATTGDGGMNYSTHGSGSGKNMGGASPMLGQHESGSDSATTKSGVSAGAVTITDSANQKQDVASLNRDTTDTNGTVARLPDMQNLLSKQAEMMSAASAAGEAVSRRIGDFADRMKKEATENGDQAGVDAWKEGGANRALMQGAGAALVTGLAGGNAVGGAAGAAIASIAAGKLNDLSSAIAGSDPTGNAKMNQALGNIVANVIATGAGGVVGGEAGAFSGYNVDRFNRQLHPDERTLAKQLAGKSKGTYTPEQIEEQMRLMGVVYVAGGSVAPGVAEELNGRTSTDPGVSWIDTGLTNANGNPLVIQVLPQANPALQEFIMANYNSARPGQIPSAYAYVPTPVPTDIRGTVANVAGGVSTAAWRFGAITAAGASIPSPYAPGLSTASYLSAVAGITADAIAQIAKPDVGQYAVSGVTGLIAGNLSDRLPGLAPAMNETANTFNNSNVGKQVQNSLNKYWAEFVNYWSGGQ
ncbi:filamentous hemagglutinin N-terminal domain-containing protein [Burkholderia sp. Ac-20345]|uniref:hemagglutinin repeat-containing protein n=1 Tax=Burkholderia sp. Ac-20345 TaxID=2703891 RepID=UPI00197C1C98|nr:hemagglutinin repeat-containing protein [Burkholderia sp. Ac-20345]MBN3778792.1 filamentous hemagglutinin N-terminal domain-containing protein [Burkholderia sp. Ac-20345]